MAAAALLAVTAAVVVVLLEQGDEDEGGVAGGARIGAVESITPENAESIGPWSAGDHVQGPGRPRAHPVRNASPRPGWRPYSGPVPILRYHAVGDFAAGEPFPELFVEPDDFVAQMDWLASHGYEAVDLRTVERAWFSGGTLPRRPVVLTFDGTEGKLGSVVLPDLSRRGWPAVVVLDGEARAAREPLVERLIAAGWEIAATGAEPAAARDRLEAELRTPVANFSVPPGSSDGLDSAALEAAGYDGATVTGAGFATSAAPFALPRITVFGLSRVDGFAEAMRSRGEGVGA